jgi:hypothetical protein
MLSWLFPQCPLPTGEKAWTEARMLWFADQFGTDRLRGAEVLLPTPDFYPKPYARTVSYARAIMEKLCGHMGLDPRSLGLEICEDFQMPGAAGHYAREGSKTIRIAQSQLEDPLRLTATLAHELSHDLLLGQGRLREQVGDHEEVTDLLPVFLGVGLFAANATVREAIWRVGNISGWEMGRQGYLPSRIFGYAFALFAAMRDEWRPAWAEHLRLDAREPLVRGLRFLRKSKDSLFHPETIHEPRHPPSTAELIELLQSRSATRRLATLWEVRDWPVPEPEVVEGVQRLLYDRDPDVPGEAALTLAAFGAAAAPAVPHLITVLHVTRPSIRIGAALALGALHLCAGEVVPELALLLEDDNPRVVLAAAQALRAYGPNAAPAATRLLAALGRALVEGDNSRIELLAQTLRVAVDDPEDAVASHFEDHELRAFALEVIGGRSRGWRARDDEWEWE